jgi:transposase InsO family protein
VVCRYGVLNTSITDSGKQFDNEPFRELCSKLYTKNYFSHGHLQANGQVEATNKTIFKVLEKKLGEKKGTWAEDLPEVLWVH